MENNLKKTVVLDYYGIPGSGKSTTSHALAEKYREEGKSVIEPSYDYDHHGSCITRKLKKISATIQFGMKSPGRFLSVYRLVKLNGYTRTSGLLNQIVNIVTKVSAVEKYNGKVDYIIFDEGLTQAAISLSINSEYPSTGNFKSILDLIPDIPEIKLVQVTLDVHEALKRIELRNSKDTRVEKLEGYNSRILLLQKYERLTTELQGRV